MVSMNQYAACPVCSISVILCLILMCHGKLISVVSNVYSVIKIFLYCTFSLSFVIGVISYLLTKSINK